MIFKLRKTPEERGVFSPKERARAGRRTRIMRMHARTRVMNVEVG